MVVNKVCEKTPTFSAGHKGRNLSPDSAAWQTLTAFSCRAKMRGPRDKFHRCPVEEIRQIQDRGAKEASDRVYKTKAHRSVNQYNFS